MQHKAPLQGIGKTVSRRAFIATAGQFSALLALTTLPTSLVAEQRSGAKRQPVLTESEQQELALSIQANFGSGFQIVSTHQTERAVHVEIEHLENRYWVASTNRHNWTIQRSTEI